MTKNQTELLNLIRSQSDSEKALLVATNILIAFLKQPESFEVPNPACPQEHD
jgi:hypothetical protein